MKVWILYNEDPEYGYEIFENVFATEEALITWLEQVLWLKESIYLRLGSFQEWFEKNNSRQAFAPYKWFEREVLT